VQNNDKKYIPIEITNVDIPIETINKSIRFERDLAMKIDELRRGTERNFSQQVKYMLRRYIEFKEKE